MVLKNGTRNLLNLATDVTQWLSQFVGIGLWPTAKTLFPGNPLEPCVTSDIKSDYIQWLYNWCYAAIQTILPKRTFGNDQNPVSGKPAETVRNISYEYPLLFHPHYLHKIKCRAWYSSYNLSISFSESPVVLAIISVETPFSLNTFAISAVLSVFPSSKAVSMIPFKSR